METSDATRFREFEHAGWERAAPAYERYWDALTTQTTPACLDRLAISRGTRLLDVACGTGRAAALALSRHAIVTGVDFSVAMLARARRHAAGARFEQADADALPFANGVFDAVLCSFGLLHLARPQAALAEMARVLRPSGRLAATVWASPDPGTHPSGAREGCRLLGIVRETVAETVTAPAPGSPRRRLRSGRRRVPAPLLAPPGPDFFQHADPERFHAALTAAGLGEITVETLPLTCALPDFDTLWSMVYDGSVRTAALLRAQAPETLAEIRQRIAVKLEPYRAPSGDGYHIPADAVLASGAKPY